MDHAPLQQYDLVYVSDSEPGIRRERRGKGFCYRLPDGSVLKDPSAQQRIRALAIPPAYTNVWICLRSNGHLQATGEDSRARKQYRYHPNWEAFRSDIKFDQLMAFGAALPRIRGKVLRDVHAEPWNENTILAALVVLLDETALRVGGKLYARQNRTYGATTLLKSHLRMANGTIELRYTAKGGKRVRHRIKHPHLQRILEKIADLPGRQLFQWPDEGGNVRTIGSENLNAYLAEIAGVPVSAKTFRTWVGSLAAFKEAWRAIRSGKQPTMKQLAGTAAMALHNTPAVCKTSYIHPSVLALTEKPFPGLVEKLSGLKSAPRRLRADERRLLTYLQLANSDR